MNKRASIIIALIVILTAASLWFASIRFFDVPGENARADERAEVQVSETIVFADGQVRDIGIKTMKSGSTALDLLEATTRVEFDGAGGSAYVTSIEGRTAQAEKREFWSFYLNGNQAEIGAGSYILQNNDVIEWRIETY